MGHPLHFHGHTFWTLGSGTGAFDDSKLNLVNPPIRDTEGIHLPDGSQFVMSQTIQGRGYFIVISTGSPLSESADSGI